MNKQVTRLQELQAQCARKKHLESALEALHAQKPALEHKTAALKAALEKEQKDVDKLEQGSLSSLFYDLIGKKEEKLTKEKREAKEAFLKYSAAARDLKGLESNIRSYLAELYALQDAPAAYEVLLQEILEQVTASGSPIGLKVLEHQHRIGALSAQLRELDEAIAAGTVALSTTDTILNALSDAENWGTWDLLGGGLLSDIAKYEALDEAQKGVEMLQVQLRSFKSELADVAINADIKVSIDGFLEFADFFFDGLFADWAVMDEIEKSVHRVEKTAQEISAVLTTLREKKDSTEASMQEQHYALEELAMQA